MIQDLSITFDSESITVITGPSGCGKSTFLNLAGGIYPQNAGVLHSGHISVNGQNLAELAPDQRAPMIGVMFQNPDLQFCMDTVENELLFCLGNVQTPPEKMPKIIQDALEFCGITHLKDRKLQSLSGGEKQKAMLACLVALDPEWLLLDEPFANVDEDSSAELVAKIEELHQKGKGILVVDHRLEYWLPVCDEICFLESNNDMNITRYKMEAISDEMLMEKGILPPSIPYKQKGDESIVKPVNPILEIKNLTVFRGKQQILNTINYTFERSKVYALLGTSGSGKSTLFGAINRLYNYQGKILLNGNDVKKRVIRKTGAIGFVTQNPQDQFVASTVLEEITIGLHRTKSLSETEPILRGIGLWGYRNFSPYMLSQGQQRRLGVASLMAYDCQVLICDEPTYAQDWKNTTAIMDSLVEEMMERGMTLIFSTHDRKLANDYADVILTLKEGELIECSKPSL
ncbi:ABC transporter ATP-binding protein [Paucisalibacillus sp. EB02]|uniref:ABC transporter ATP-binding protein n=1 Tax=Paucisalibacillus sp. EB02 TaxID=1347087 RepID=UPI0004B105C9|nr:ABC transporter ATP-binding protein [Paucisalibacillus sp. EB02]